MSLEDNLNNPYASPRDSSFTDEEKAIIKERESKFLISSICAFAFECAYIASPVTPQIDFYWIYPTIAIGGLWGYAFSEMCYAIKE